MRPIERSRRHLAGLVLLTLAGGCPGDLERTKVDGGWSDPWADWGSWPAGDGPTGGLGDSLAPPSLPPSVDGSASTASEKTFSPEADAYVDEDTPADNYGGATALSVDKSPNRRAYLRFVVFGLPGAVQSATLRLYVSNSCASGPEVRGTSGGWQETGITWGNKPASSAVVAKLDKAAKGKWAEVDVTSSVTGNGAISFALLPTSSDGCGFHSREGAHAPELVLQLTGSTPPPDAGPTPDMPPLPPDSQVPTSDTAPPTPDTVQVSGDTASAG